MTPISFVYFDLGNVLATFDIGRACRNVAARWGVDPQLVRDSLWTSGMQERFEHGHEDDESFATIARQVLGIDADLAPTRELLNALSDMFEPIAEMEPVVASVRRSGVKIGILSNTCTAHWRWLMTANYPALQGPFDRLVLSYQWGIMKPHTRIYEVAQEAAAVAPETILFLDDRLDNVEAARSLGWQAFQYTDAATAQEVLRCRGVIE